MRHLLITGATSAIGSALVKEYAAPGVTLYLHGRNAERLNELAGVCEAQGAQVVTTQLDLRDFTALRAWLTQMGALDLVIVNAGMNTHVGPNGEPEPWDEVEAVLDVNLKAAMVIVQAVLPAMRAQDHGQIALVSSLAGYFGLPVTPTYCATKAGLKAYGEALRGWLEPEGIKVNVIMPGYVKSPMCDAMPGPKPFLWSPERAAKVIKRGLAQDKPRISFPFPLNWGTWWLTVLPAAVSTRIVRWLGYTPEPRRMVVPDAFVSEKSVLSSGNIAIVLASRTTLAPAEWEELCRARGTLRFLLGEETRHALLSRALRLDQVLIARCDGKLAGYLFIQPKWQSPVRPRWRDFWAIYAWSGLWRYPIFLYVEWRTLFYSFYIYSMRVLPQFRKRGVASQLLNAAEQIAAHNKIPAITLEVLEGNEAAISLYRKIGYEAVGGSRFKWLSRWLGFSRVIRMRKVIVPRTNGKNER